MAQSKRNRPSGGGSSPGPGLFDLIGGAAKGVRSAEKAAGKGAVKTVSTVIRPPRAKPKPPPTPPPPPKTRTVRETSTTKAGPPAPGRTIVGPAPTPLLSQAQQGAARGVSDRAAAQQGFRKRYLDTVAKVRSGKMTETEGGAYLKGLGFPDSKNPFVQDQGLAPVVHGISALGQAIANPETLLVTGGIRHPRPGLVAKAALGAGEVGAGIAVPTAKLGAGVLRGAATSLTGRSLAPLGQGEVAPKEEASGVNIPPGEALHAAKVALPMLPKIAAGGAGAVAGLMTADPESWKGLAGDVWGSMLALGQLAGLGQATVSNPSAGVEIGRNLARSIVQGVVDQYGPDVTYGQVLAEGRRHPFIYGTNAALVVTPGLRAALTALGVGRGTRLVEALSRIKGLGAFKGDPVTVREAWQNTYFPAKPRTLNYQTLGTEKPGSGAWFKTRGLKSGEKVPVEIPRSKSPLTRPLQAGYDAVSKVVDHLGPLRKLPISESKRAAMAMRRQLDRKLKRLPAEVQAAFIDVTDAIHGDDNEHYATALATMLQKPNGLTQEEWVTAVISDLKDMLENPGRFQLPAEDLSPAMQRRANEISGLETKAQAALLRRRDTAHRSILDEQGRLAGAIDEVQGKQKIVEAERTRIEQDETISPEDKANELAHLDAESNALDTQLNVAREMHDRVTVNQTPIEAPQRDALEARLRELPYFTSKRAKGDRVADALRVTDAVARRWASQVVGRTPEDWYALHKFTDDPADLPTGTASEIFHQERPAEVNLPDAQTLHDIALDGVDTSVFREHNIGGFLGNLGHYLRRGEPYRKWYENSGNEILRYANGDRDLAARIAGMVAIYSASRAPTENINLAVQALRQWQDHREITVGSASQAEKAMQSMRGEEWNGLKTNRFYANMLKTIDPKRYAREFKGGEVTNDIWMARLFGLKTEAPTPREYEAMTKITQNIAQELGWSPEEVQAALWVPAKADAGVGGKGITPLPDHEAGIDFARALNEEGVRFPVETAPGRRIGDQEYWRRYDDLTPKRKLAYHRAKIKVLVKFLKESKLFAAVEGHGVGLYENAANPATVIAIPTASKGSALRSATDRAVINQVTSLVSEIWHQDAKAWFRPIYRKGVEDSPGRQKGAWIRLPRPLTEEEALGLQRTLKQRLARPLNAQELRDARAAFEKRTGRAPNRDEVARLKKRRIGGDVALPPGPGHDLYALNFSGAKNPLFHEVIQEEVGKLIGRSLKDEEYTFFDFDGARANRSRYGQTDRETGFTGRPDVREAAHRFRAASDEVDRRFLGEPPGPVGRGRGAAELPAEVPGAARSPDASARRLAPDEPLEGLPPRRPVGRKPIPTGPSAEVRGLAETHSERSGIPYTPPSIYQEVDPARAERIAQAYEGMLDLNDPRATPEYVAEVLGSYQAMADETLAQYRVLEEAGYHFEFYPRGADGNFVDPYDGNPWGAMADLRENKHMYVFPTEGGFGGEGDLAKAASGRHVSPLLADSGVSWGGQPVLVNDLFRAVHDVFGHFKEGVGFRAHGEENAWRSHSAMYSPQARRAMTSETRGQNSWVNYGPHAEHNRTADQIATIYAEQKTGVLPQWAVDEGATDATDLVHVNQSRAGDILGSTAWLKSAPGQRVIYLAENADFSTLVHELFGHATEEMRASFPDEFGEVQRQMGKSYADWTVDDHEQFARWMENYFRTGYAATPELVPVFDRVKGWMRSIYAGLVKTLGGRIPVQTRQLFDAYFGANMDENVWRVVAKMNDEPWDPAITGDMSYGIQAERLQKQMASLKKGAETRTYNKSLDKLTNDLDALTAKMDALHEKGDEMTPEEFDQYTETVGNVLVKQAEILVRADKREQELRSKLADLEKSLAKGFDNRRFQGALAAMKFIAQDREDILREAFGDHYDEVFANRRDLLAEWLVSKGLIKQDYEKGTAFYYPMTMESSTLRRQLKVPAVPLTGDVIGKTKADLLNLHRQNQMILWQRGDWNADPAVLIEAHMRAQSYSFMTEVKKLLWSMGREMTPDERADFRSLGPVYVLNPDGTAISSELRAQMTDARLGAAEDANKVQDGLSNNEGALLAKLADYFNNFAIDPAQIPADWNTANHAHLRIVPRGVVDTVLRPLQGGRTGLTKVWDAGTTMARFALIYANAPGYMIANGANNVILNLLQMGAKLPWAIGRGQKLLNNDKLMNRVLAEMGDLPAFAAIVRGRNYGESRIAVKAHAKQLEDRYLNAISIVDRYPRAWAWVHAAGLRGYKSEDDLFRLLGGKTAKTARDRELVANEATQHMIDFNRPRDWETKHLSRVLFIWPFIRGATAWPFWYAKNYPDRVALLNMAGQPLVERQKRMLGPLPYWYRDLFPVSTSGDRADIVNAGLVSPTSVAEQELQLIHDTVAGFLGKKPDAQTTSWIDMFTPVLRDAQQLATGQNSFGTPTSLHDLFFGTVLPSAVPGYRIGDSLIHWDSGGKTPRIYQPYYRGLKNDALRVLVRAGPMTASISWLNEQAQTHGDVATSEKIKQQTAVAEKQWRKLGLGPVDQTLSRAVSMKVTFDDWLKEYSRKVGGDPDFLPTRVEGGGWSTKYSPSTFEQAVGAWNVMHQQIPVWIAQQAATSGLLPPIDQARRLGISPTSAIANQVGDAYMGLFHAWTSLPSTLSAASKQVATAKKVTAEEPGMDTRAKLIAKGKRGDPRIVALNAKFKRLEASIGR